MPSGTLVIGPDGIHCLRIEAVDAYPLVAVTDRTHWLITSLPLTVYNCHSISCTAAHCSAKVSSAVPVLPSELSKIVFWGSRSITQLCSWAMQTSACSRSCA